MGNSWEEVESKTKHWPLGYDCELILAGDEVRHAGYPFRLRWVIPGDPRWIPMLPLTVEDARNLRDALLEALEESDEAD